jgi:hypothetical protein
MYSMEIVLRVARERQRELLQEAGRARMLQKAKPARYYALADRVLVGAGDMLVRTGEKLQALAAARNTCVE